MKPVLFAIVCAFGLSACGKKEEAVKVAAPPTKKAVETPAPEDVTRLQGELKHMDAEEAKFIAVPNTPADPAPAVQIKKAATPPETKEEIKKAAPVSNE